MSKKRKNPKPKIVVQNTGDTGNRSINEIDLALQTLQLIEERFMDAASALQETISLHEASGFSQKLIQDLVLEILRWRGRLDYFFSKCPFFKAENHINDCALMNFARLILYFRLMSTTLTPAGRENVISGIIEKAPDEMLQTLKELKSWITASDFQVDFPSHEETPVKFISSYFSHPQWLVEILEKDLGVEGALAFCERSNLPRGVTVQVNPRKTSRRGVRRSLQENGLSAQATNYSPYGLSLFGMKSVTSLDFLNNGSIEPAMESLQIGAILASSLNPFCVVDTCRKSLSRPLLIAALLTEGEVVMPNLREECRQCAEHISYWSGDTVRVSALELSGNTEKLRSDVVVVEAPGSRVGHICLSPEIKWQLSADDIRRAHEWSLNELDRWQILVKEGGFLIYNSSSVLKAENENVVENFLNRHSEFKIAPIKDFLPPSCHKLINETGFLEASPHQTEIEGIFVALLQRH